MTKDEALLMAIEYIDKLKTTGQTNWLEINVIQNACKEALEQPAQEPAYQVGEIVNPYGSNINIKQPAQGMKAVSYPKDNKWIDMVEQPAQEPVAWISESTLKHSAEYHNRFDDAKSWAEIRAVDRKTTNCDVPLYTHPASSWQGLSDDEIMNIARESYMSRDGGDIKFARAIEQALKEKNHG